MAETHILSRILITNDDGIGAPGLAALREVADTLAEEVWVVAPDHDQSGVSHSISLHDPLRVSRRGEREFSISGTPGDCVVMAARHLMERMRPDLVLSGINRGANLGVETVFSGTVGAAMTGMLLGLPSIALSQAFTDRNAVRWGTATTLAPGVIRQFIGGDWSRNACLNINFPDKEPDEVGPVELTTQGVGHLNDIEVISGLDPRSLDFHWLSLRRSAGEDTEGSETRALHQGRISVTPMQFERSNLAVQSRLKTFTRQ